MGVQGHEAPWLAPGDTTPVAEGMVFSSEPGIYRPGLDGYRTINTMIVGAAGVEVPSRFLATHAIGQRVLPL
jgi:Xaa-Pro aminopeptidase